MDCEELREICIDRYELCEKDFRHRFDIKDLVVYLHGLQDHHLGKTPLPYMNQLKSIAGDLTTQ